MWSSLCSFLLKLWGWRIVGDWPADPQFITVVVPHTSNWDFPLGVLVRGALNRDIKFAAKDSLFRWPFGAIFRSWGGVPVDRSKRTNFVDAVVDLLKAREGLSLCIAPEGTRKKVSQLKTGFYYIALGADIPLALTAFDWGKREVRISEPLYLTGDKEADFAKIESFFEGAEGKIPAYGYSNQSKA